MCTSGLADNNQCEVRGARRKYCRIRASGAVLKNFLRLRQCPDSENTTCRVQLQPPSGRLSRGLARKCPGTRLGKNITHFVFRLFSRRVLTSRAASPRPRPLPSLVAPRPPPSRAGSSIRWAIHRRRQTRTRTRTKLSPARFSRPGHPSPPKGLFTSHRYT